MEGIHPKIQFFIPRKKPSCSPVLTSGFSPSIVFLNEEVNY